MKEPKLVVHVRSWEMASGPGFPDPRADRLRDLGYEIHDVPDDVPRHPTYVPCPYCNVGEA
ncbi:MAG TPA: hypothetical protein VIP77_20955 [Jiangellaceae bacterium]